MLPPFLAIDHGEREEWVSALLFLSIAERKEHPSDFQDGGSRGLSWKLRLQMLVESGWHAWTQIGRSNSKVGPSHPPLVPYGSEMENSGSWWDIAC